MRGRIYFHEKFGYHDGEYGQKFIVLINNPQNQDPYLFLKVTSRQKNKPSAYGCHIIQKVFYIPPGKAYFKKGTWVQLHEIYAFSQKELVKAGIEKVMIHKDKLSEQMINEVKNCLLKSCIEDIEPEYLMLIKRG